MTLDRLKFLSRRIRERLWVKPLAICVLSIIGALAARLTDRTGLERVVPEISAASIETLLSVMASSMLVIATFAVASMVSAYASAAGTATPRSFSLVVSDDVSQNALSTFIGAFIFSIVALTAVKNGYFAATGRFTLFVLTVAVFAAVILTFVRWVDRIARLGRMGSTIDKVEQATAAALERRRSEPALRGVPAGDGEPSGRPVFASEVGYVQRVDVEALQALAEEHDGRVTVAALPGAFAAPGRPLAYFSGPDAAELDEVAECFLVGGERLFDDDPRFGLIVLSEIAGRALSPGINDPGTAIDVIGTLVRLFVGWAEPRDEEEPQYDRVEVPEIDVRDLFDDAFTAIGRDGAGTLEVAVRLQKALRTLATCGDEPMRDAARDHARLALARAEAAMESPHDLAAVRKAAGVA